MPPHRGRRGANRSTGGGVRVAQPWSVSIQTRPVEQIKHLETNLSFCNDTMPILQKWIRDKSKASMATFETGYSLLGYEPTDESTGVLSWKTKGATETQKTMVYRKLIPCLQPYRWMKFGERVTTVPGDAFWQYGPSGIQDQEAMAYTDALASILMNQLIEKKSSPHFARCFGAHRAITPKYTYKLEEDFEQWRFTKWFWKNQELGWFRLRVKEKSTGRLLSNIEVTNLCKPDEEFLRDSESDLDSESEREDVQENEAETDEADEELSVYSMKDVSAPTPALAPLEEIESVSTVTFDEPYELHKTQRDRASTRELESEEGEGLEELTFTDEYDIYAELDQMPIVALYVEKMTDCLDTLLEEQGTLPHSPSSPEWTRMWSAWIFQICVALCQLQSWVSLTHNDLHTNNIVWKETSEEYLYYRADTTGQSWKIPTYGRIFQIIDFGRAIYSVKGQLVISGDHKDGNDAAGQYNFGPIQDRDLPYVPPNKSFDLARLSYSLLRALFPVNPPEIPTGKVLSKEGDWVVRETVNPLFNLLWSWLVTDSGETILEDEQGGEKYPGFDLYSVIAAEVHGAMPYKQIVAPIYKEFIVDRIDLASGTQIHEIPF